MRHPSDEEFEMLRDDLRAAVRGLTPDELRALEFAAASVCAVVAQGGVLGTLLDSTFSREAASELKILAGAAILLGRHPELLLPLEVSDDNPS